MPPPFMKKLLLGLAVLATALVLFLFLRGAPGPALPAGPPDPARFTQVILDRNLNEPMELDLLDADRILFIERHGAVKLHDQRTGTTRVVDSLSVYDRNEDGLLGVAVDPRYAENHWIYLLYSPPDPTPRHRLSRFVFDGDRLDRSSERVLLEIPNQRDECCHSAGSLEFGPDGTLYLSQGDNTNPFASDGYAPLDERPGRSPWDAQKSAANPNDLRGKILRIRPEPDGTYSIPEGNLFPPGTPGTRPEIYVMGNRNPFRIAIDRHTGYLYWGEVGPDAGEDHPERGPRGHDEVNQARAPGFFGWPYFVADNRAYRDYDFATETSGPAFDPAAPVNDSPNNTGRHDLPPAQPAFIWYPYGPSAAFPLTGQGGRNAMAGPVYYFDDYAPSDRKFPRYYDGKLFIYDWMRGWIMAVTMTPEGDFLRMEPFLPAMTFHNPMDMLFGPDGAMYMLEYGTKWFSRNQDARLFRIDYNAGNLPPRLAPSADVTLGPAPLTVHFSAHATDDDGGPLSYAWSFTETDGTDAPNPTFTFTRPGRYRPTLTVTDAAGEATTASLDVAVGNAPPNVTIDLAGNTMFYWPGVPLAYSVQVTDPEDGTPGRGIDSAAVTFTVDRLPEGRDLTTIAQGHAAMMEASDALVGKALIEASDCQACHKRDEASVGPSFRAVADRYRTDPGAPAALAEKVIRGGGGVWGGQAMAPHPQLTPEEVAVMIRYVLSVGGEAPGPRLPLSGTLPIGHEPGAYVLTASYTDRGGVAVGPLTGRDVVILAPPRLQAEAAGTPLPPPEGLTATTPVVALSGGDTLSFGEVDLTGGAAWRLHVGLLDGTTTGGRLALHLDDPNAPPVAVAPLPAGPAGWQDVPLAFDAAPGRHDLYLVVSSAETEAVVCFLDWIELTSKNP